MGAFQEHIDAHVHCRDWNEAYKATIKSVTDLARTQKIYAVFDMPNTNPPIISKELVEKRIKTAKRAGCLDGYYLYIGITSNPDQILDAVEVVKHNPRVVGIKMFAGRSIGDLAIVDEFSQMKVYESLAQVGYDGILAVHCEKESLFKMNLWEPNKPWSWNFTRPPEAEVESVKDQIRFAKLNNFKGVLHICHVSTPQTVQIIREESELNITCGVTPHHLTFTIRDMAGINGLIYKVNPPLRDYSTMILLRKYLKEGKIDWIETDHAPHTQREKLFPPYLSGIPSLMSYSSFIDNLMADGFTKEQISNLTYRNIKKIFKKVTQ